jgi:hypothetical protein
MADIFLSYSSKDVDRIEPFVKLLERENWSVWWDYEIPVGEEFPETIEEEIKKAGCVVVLWSEHSIKSRWVRIETNEASKRDILVPALIDNVAIPFQYSLLNTAKLYDWDKKSLSHPEIKKFLRSIKNKIEPPASSASPAIIKTPQTVEPASNELFGFFADRGFDSSSKKTLIILFAVLGVIITLSLSIILYKSLYPDERAVVNTSSTPISKPPVSNNPTSTTEKSNNSSPETTPDTNSVTSTTATPFDLTDEPVNSNLKATPVIRRDIREIIISETETQYSGAKLAEWLNSQERIKASYHIIIDHDGVPYFMTDLNSIANHTPQHNNNSIGIGLSHLKGESYSEAQLNGLIGQLANLAYKYKIRPENIKSKQEINPERYPRDITTHINFIREKVAEKLKQF